MNQKIVFSYLFLLPVLTACLAPVMRSSDFADVAQRRRMQAMSQWQPVLKCRLPGLAILYGMSPDLHVSFQAEQCRLYTNRNVHKML